MPRAAKCRQRRKIIMESKSESVQVDEAASSHQGAEKITIHIVSRLSSVKHYIDLMAEDVFPEKLRILYVPPHRESLLLTDKAIARLVNAEIVVIDPDILALNFNKMPNLQWAHSTKSSVHFLCSYMSEEPSFKITRSGGEECAKVIAEYVFSHICNWKETVEGSCGHGDERCMLKCKDECSSGPVTVGILGAGCVAEAVSKVLRSDSVRVIAFARTFQGENIFTGFDRATLCLDKILLESDYIINTLPETRLTVGLLNGEALEKCRKRPLIVNVGHCQVIDEPSLMRAISCNWISGIILDEQDKSNFPATSELWSMPEVVITSDRLSTVEDFYVALSFIRALSYYTGGFDMPLEVDWASGY